MLRAVFDLTIHKRLWFNYYCMYYKQLLDSVFVISRIIKVEMGVISQTNLLISARPQPKAETYNPYRDLDYSGYWGIRTKKIWSCTAKYKCPVKQRLSSLSAQQETKTENFFDPQQINGAKCYQLEIFNQAAQLVIGHCGVEKIALRMCYI